MSETLTEQLVAEYLAGKQEAAAHLLDRYGKMAYAVIGHLLYQSADRDDVYQEACLRAFSNLQQLDDPARFGGWLKQIAIRSAIDHIRRRRVQAEQLNDHLADPGPWPETSAVESSVQQQVRQAVNSLPEYYRQVIVLYYWSDCSYREISAALGIPLGTVMSRLHKAKSLVSRAMDLELSEEKGVEKWT